jgi:hypothetical protein
MSAQIFNCPASNGSPGFTSNTILKFSNWEDSPTFGQTLSYSMNCPFPGSTALTTQWTWDSTLSSDFPLMADINPGITGGLSPTNNVTQVTSSSSTRDMMAGNSNNHKNRGQNVLYGDYHVAWQQSPFCGPPQAGATTGNTPGFNDNIYTVRTVITEVGGHFGTNSQYPCDALDSYLLPSDDAPGSSPL